MKECTAVVLSCVLVKLWVNKYIIMRNISCKSFDLLCEYAFYLRCLYNKFVTLFLSRLCNLTGYEPQCKISEFFRFRWEHKNTFFPFSIVCDQFDLLFCRYIHNVFDKIRLVYSCYTESIVRCKMKKQLVSKNSFFCVLVFTLIYSFILSVLNLLYLCICYIKSLCMYLCWMAEIDMIMSIVQ